MKAGLLLVASAAIATALPQRYQGHQQHPANRQDPVVETVTVVDTVTATNPAAVVFVDGNGFPRYTSFVAGAGSDAASSPTAAMYAAPPPAASSSSELVTPSSISVQPPPPSTSTSTTEAAAPPAAPSSDAQSLSIQPTSSASPASSAPPAPSSSGFTPGVGGSTSSYALAYSPYNSDNSCKSQDQVNQDFESISNYSMIRLYGTDCDQTATVLSAAKAKGMKLFTGIWDPTQVSTEVQTIITAAKEDWSYIDTVAVGNEGVNDGRYTVAQVTSAIGSARSQLQAAGYTGKVVTVDTFIAMIANPELCLASDFAAANCHAFFDGGVEASGAGKFVLTQAQRVSEACGGKDTMITESGWPSQGQTNGKAVPSPENQAAAISSLRSAFSNNLILFSAFNDNWKQNSAGTFGTEHYWGILGNAPS